MRKIEEAMLAAVRAGANRAMGNTMVTHADGVTRVFLHGHEIARNLYDGSGWKVSLAGWDTTTTRSRLSALLRGESRAAVYPKGLSVSSRKGVVRIHDARGEIVIDADGWFEVVL